MPASSACGHIRAHHKLIASYFTALQCSREAPHNGKSSPRYEYRGAIRFVVSLWRGFIPCRKCSDQGRQASAGASGQGHGFAHRRQWSHLSGGNSRTRLGRCVKSELPIVGLLVDALKPCGAEGQGFVLAFDGDDVEAFHECGLDGGA